MDFISPLFLPIIDRLPSNVFHDAFAEFISLIKPRTLLVSALNACCPIPVKTPNAKPLFILLARLSVVFSAPFRVDIKPLSTADSTAFTE